MAKIIAFSSNKGGVLKTSLTVNIAGVLSSHGKKVLLVDLDNQGNVATTFGQDPDNIDFTIYDLMTKSEDLTDPHQAVQHVEKNLDMVVANDDMAYFEIDVLTNLDKFPHYFDLLTQAIQPFLKEYDFILMDTPPQMGLIAANIFSATHEIVIPYQPEEYAFRSLVKTINAIEQFKKTNKQLSIKEIVPVKVRRTVLHRAYTDTARAFVKSRGIRFSDISIKESVKYAEMSARFNVPITLLDELPKSLVQYKDIYESLVKEMGYLE